MDLEKLKYPIGKFSPKKFTAENKQEAIKVIRNLPGLLEDETKNLSKDQIDTPYRPGGWTIRQLVHHIADSHMNAYIRFKLALTEDHPIVKPYREDLWAKLPDSELDIDLSLRIIESVHARWTTILENMTDSDFERTYFHPEANQSSSLAHNLFMYEWHSMHHLAHIQNTIFETDEAG